MRVAAIDVGTNTTRLLAVDASAPTSYRELDRRLAFTRLGEGVDSSRTLRDDAVERTIHAVAEYCAECGEINVQRLRVAGTSALRDATNVRAFKEAIKRISGAELEVISGEEEARLTFLGATLDLPHGRHLVCDIGGGSTELVMGNDGRIEVATSLDIGSVRMTERYIRADPPATEEILLMEDAIDQKLSGASLGDVSGAEFVGVAGTVTTLGAMHLGLTEYDPAKTHLLQMDVKDVRRQYRRVAGMTVADRRKIPGMPEGRADVIVAGASILVRVMAHWAFDHVIVSEKDILDGLVIDMLEDQTKGTD